MKKVCMWYFCYKFASIFEKEKYMDLILEADPDKEIVEKYIKDAEMYGLFENEKILAEIIITKVNNNICELKI